MKLKVYSVYDEIAKVHNTPFFMHNDEMAIRAFNNIATDPTSTIAQNPTDYKLHCIGVFNDETAHINPEDIPVYLASGQVAKTKEQ